MDVNGVGVAIVNGALGIGLALPILFRVYKMLKLERTSRVSADDWKAEANTVFSFLIAALAVTLVSNYMVSWQTSYDIEGTAAGVPALWAFQLMVFVAGGMLVTFIVRSIQRHWLAAGGWLLGFYASCLVAANIANERYNHQLGIVLKSSWWALAAALGVSSILAFFGIRSEHKAKKAAVENAEDKDS